MSNEEKKLIRYEQGNIYTKLLEKAYGDFWTHNSVSYKDDLYGLQHKFEERAKSVFLKTIGYQSLMDNDVVGVYTDLAKFVDDQTLQLLYLYIAQNESVHCLKEEDEILTNKGFVKLKDLKPDMLVANWWQPKQGTVGTVDFRKPKSITKQRYIGDMINFKQRGMNYTVTPKHRVIKYKKDKQTGEIVWDTEKAKDINIDGWKLPIKPFEVNQKIEEYVLSNDNKIVKSTIKYDGNIVGVEVDSTYIIVRFDGKYVAVTGNSLSYAYGLQQTFGNDAEKLFQEMEKEPAVLQRMKKEEQIEEDFITKFNKNEATIKDFVRVVVHTFLLEQIKFPISFFVVFKLNDTYNGAINGFSQALKEIAQDELNTHVPTNMNVLKQLIRDGKVDKEFVENEVRSRILEIIKEEEVWVEFLFSDGEPNGITRKLYRYLVEYFSDEALRKLGFDKMFNVEKNSEISWFDNYRDINKSVVAQQETDSVGYQSLIINDLNRFDEE